ncbi:MAG TPA: SRPBCC domain-containing protein [Terriglobales bacterium]|jgi:uncharacterized protein YndB with AHSA1/START domain
MATALLTPDQNTVIAEIFIAAPRERVFQAITDPSQVERWWGQSDLYRVTEWNGDLRPGGKWSSIGVHADGNSSFRVEGEYLEVDPPRLLVHTWNPSWSNHPTTVVRWELEERDVHGLQSRGPQRMGKGTLVRIRHDGFAGAPKEAEGHGEGWKRVLGWMQAFVEESKTVDSRASAVQK